MLMVWNPLLMASFQFFSFGLPFPFQLIMVLYELGPGLISLNFFFYALV